MSKRRKNQRAAAPTGKREKVRDVFVPRPFEGLTDEPEWIALRELVPAASAPLRLTPALVDEYGDRPITLATVLPMAAPAMSREDGHILVGLQRHQQSGDVSRDLAESLLCALRTAAGAPVAVPPLPGPGPRLQDILVDGPLEITLHEGFEFWLVPAAAEDPTVQASLERANAAIYPTVRLAAARAAYWCRVPEKAHVRWVLPEAEEAALDALARLGAAGSLALGEGTKFAGMFRAHGRLVPVWDLPEDAPAGDWEHPVADFAKRYAEALTETGPLDAAARRSRQGLLGRQLTLR
ncbi:hypothetical protein SAMN05443287_10776 [Micromonospora phaseoli]|uniref:DUF5926 domain-containing protein n=1 Tax=Micromonospora phaseoli TaxID=1144548 RepID=A0A1H7BGT9_9ACTN|nr:DUF5926 family protein [Micromonospora phaseoli]PZV95146.1 hypothetical protein CLV64_108286 [Micromonospora phaseoli]GIJ78965.1 preprotein translocase SecA [Micromonospora phaseoli]SEJ73742.1 hypothetical protein SAMN05443287_10776 [Micromonospora phaseoli]